MHLTTETSIIRLHMRLLDLSVLDHKRIPLAPVAAENRRAIELQVQRGGELHGGVAEEADLQMGALVERRGGCGGEEILTPEVPEGSRVAPHAFILGDSRLVR